jgi:hypothetical protein
LNETSKARKKDEKEISIGLAGLNINGKKEEDKFCLKYTCRFFPVIFFFALIWFAPTVFCLYVSMCIHMLALQTRTSQFTFIS